MRAVIAGLDPAILLEKVLWKLTDPPVKPGGNALRAKGRHA
jgi:hypothetical protein